MAHWTVSANQEVGEAIPYDPMKEIQKLSGKPETLCRGLP